MAQPRAQQRADFDQGVRLRLLEDDADDAEAHGIALQAQVATDIGAIRTEVDGMKKLLVGILVSVTTACILLVVNIITVSGGS